MTAVRSESFDSVSLDTSANREGTTSTIADNTLVLLDFDGTITTKDTLIEFVRFYRGPKKFWTGLITLTPIMALYLFRVLPNWKAKQYFLSQYFKGERIDDFNKRCKEFTDAILPALIRPGAAKTIEEFKKANATIVVVSASAENWVKPWCDTHGLVCLATRLEAVNGIITGKIKGKNCYGDEKVCRVRESFDLDSFDKIIAYGDSSGDKAMLALANRSYYRPWRNE